MKKVMTLLMILFLGFSLPLMARDHGDRGPHGGGEFHHDQGRQHGHYKHRTPQRERFYKKEYVRGYHHGRHKHFRHDAHGRYVPVYVTGYREHVCGADNGYYNDNGNFINLNMDSSGKANLNLNLNLGH